MKMDLFDLREFVKVNKFVPVTSPIALASSKLPNPEGIFSYEIFGYTTKERKNTFSYIELNTHLFHPQVFKTLNRMGVLGKIAIRQKYAIVVDRKIHICEPDEEGAKTGIDFFYDNWESINWSSPNLLTHKSDVEEDELSIDKTNRFKFFKFLQNNKNQAFVDIWLVIPPFYRDLNSDGMSLGDDINKLYNELISKAKSLKTGFGFSSFGDIARIRMQDIINMLYDMSLSPVTGKSVDIKDNGTLKGNPKRSILRKNLLGRFLDYSASSVITAPLASSCETVDDFAKFGEVTIPLQSFISMTKPFFVNFILDFTTKCINNLLSYDFKKIDSRF